eukprot:9363457-Lingulodinium_polyedra.AAC.1
MSKRSLVGSWRRGGGVGAGGATGPPVASAGWTAGLTVSGSRQTALGLNHATLFKCFWEALCSSVTYA